MPSDLALIGVGALSYALGAYARPAAGTVAVLVLLVALEAAFGIPDDSWVPLAVCTVGPWLAGRAVRARRGLVAALAERTRELEAEEAAFARLAVRRERARIARELHDIVAHNLAVMVIQAGAGRMEPAGAPAAALRFAGIGEAGGQALAEMDRLVDLLHAEPDGVPERLEAVLAQAQAAGLRVRATPWPAGVQLPRELGETVVRIVQEGVTNTLKHAPGSDLDVGLAVRDGGLEIDLRDRGSSARPTLADTGAGLGLAGLRERVAAAGGQLTAGPVPDGGWRLHARLPGAGYL